MSAYRLFRPRPLSNNREGKGKIAITIIEMDGESNKELLSELSSIEDVYTVSNINKI